MLDSGRIVSRGRAFRPFGNIPKLEIRGASSEAAARVLPGAVEGLFRFRKADRRPGVFGTSTGFLWATWVCGELRALLTG